MVDAPNLLLAMDEMRDGRWWMPIARYPCRRAATTSRKILVGPFARVTGVSFGSSACGVERVGYTYSEADDRVVLKCTETPALLRLDTDSHLFTFDPVLIVRGGFVLVRVVNDTQADQLGPTISVHVQ